MELPNNLEAEQAVLGAIFIDNGALMEIDLQPEHFYKPSHAKIYEVMCDLRDLGEPIDVVHTVERLKYKSYYDSIGIDYLTLLMTKTFTSANIQLHAGIVADLFIKRQLVQACQRASRMAQEGSSVEDMMEALSLDLKIDSRGHRSLHVVVEEVVERTETRKDGIEGLTTGLLTLDLLTDGFRAPDLVILGGRPSMGKTALALQFAIASGEPVHINSLEMSDMQLVTRIISNISNIENTKIRKSIMTSTERMLFRETAQKVKKMPISIDSKSVKLSDIKRSIIQAHRKGCKMAVVDYLQLIDNKGSHDSREQEVGDASKSLKHLAKSLGIPIIALAQLNRNLESRENKRPMLSDLRDSGQVEQDADIVMFVHRPGYFQRQKDMSAVDNKAEIIVAKGRDIGTDTILVNWDAYRGKFTEIGGLL